MSGPGKNPRDAIRKVLFATDFSAESRAALLSAAAWARRFDATLHLLHVVVPYDPHFEPIASAAIPSPEAMTDAMEASAERRLSELQREVPDPAPVMKAHCRRASAAADGILEQAAEIGADLAVMSSHGRRGMRRLFLGSVTEEVVRRASCPVLVERRAGEKDADLSGDVDRLLVPVDFSQPSHDSLELARCLAAACGATIDLLTVVHGPTHPDLYAAGEMPAVVQQAAAVESRARERIEALAAEVGGDVVVETFVRRGDPALAIVDHARERDADGIVLATHGLTGLSRALLGSVAEKVLRRAERQVLVVPAAIAFQESDDADERASEPAGAAS